MVNAEITNRQMQVSWHILPYWYIKVDNFNLAVEQTLFWVTEEGSCVTAHSR